MPIPSYSGVPLGLEARRDIGKTYTYRVRRGNGFYGSVQGRRYQDRFTYVVPSSINNPEGAPARETLAEAVLAWQALSESEKNKWRAKEKSHKGTTGYALFIKQFFKDNYPIMPIPTGTIVIWSGAIVDIPSGWHLCDGTAGTPDLRDRFLVGAGSGYGVGATGGEASHTLTVSEIPAHTHPVPRQTALGGVYDALNKQTNSEEDGVTKSTGGGASHENRPPYYALAYIMKT